MTQEQIEHEKMRRKLWCDTAVAYTSSSNSAKKEGAENWANATLKAFDEKFPNHLRCTDIKLPGE